MLRRRTSSSASRAMFLLTLVVLLFSNCGRTDGSSSSSSLAQRFAIEPVDKTVMVNETTLLACRVVNKAGSIQWTRDSFGLGTERELVGYPRYTMTGNDEEGDFSLQIRNVQLEDDARFQCQVGAAADGVAGIRSRDAVLTVHVPPDAPVIVNGDLLRTTAGVQVALTCQALNGKPAAHITWLDHEDNAVPAEQVSYSTHLLSDGKRASAFSKWTFVATREQDGMTFTCRSENPAVRKAQTASIRLAVRYPPAVTLRMDRDHVLEGEDVTLTCDAEANPQHVVFKWFRDSSLLVGEQGKSYTMRTVRREENGVTISCHVSNSVGVANDSKVLTLDFGPVLRSPLPPVHGVLPGQELRLKCDVAANPAPQIIWLFEGSSHVLSTETELLIPEMSYDTAGRYVCRASVPGFPEVSTSTQVFVKESFPMLMIVGAAITAVVLTVSSAISVILCFKKKTGDSTDSLSDLKDTDIGKASSGSAAVNVASHYLSVPDSGSSANGSDLKGEVRTSSSLSEQREWMDASGRVTSEMAQVVENIYNYTQQQQLQQQQQDRFYSANNKIDNSSSGANNNSAAGYVPYADYGSRSDFLLQPSSAHTPHGLRAGQHQQQQQLVYPSSHVSPQHPSLVLTADPDSYVDPLFGRLCIASPAYLRMPFISSSIESQMSTHPPLSPVMRSTSQTSSPGLLNAGSSPPRHSHQQHQVSSTSATHGSSCNQVLVTSARIAAKQAALATHV